MGEPSSPRAVSHSHARSSSSSSPSATPLPALEQPPPSPLSLNIRFAIALPDLPIFIPSATTTTVSALKRQIRDALPAEQSRRRLRLINSGKVLADSATLASQISTPKAPPKSTSVKGKEKATAQEDEEERLRRVIYIHCSVGDELTDEELVEEAENKEVGSSPLAYLPISRTDPE